MPGGVLRKVLRNDTFTQRDNARSLSLGKRRPKLVAQTRLVRPLSVDNKRVANVNERSCGKATRKVKTPAFSWTIEASLDTNAKFAQPATVRKVSGETIHDVVVPVHDVVVPVSYLDYNRRAWGRYGKGKQANPISFLAVPEFPAGLASSDSTGSAKT